MNSLIDISVKFREYEINYKKIPTSSQQLLDLLRYIASSYQK
jgi:hypothetical protein